MMQYLFVGVALLAHYGGTNLAKAYAMSPAPSVYDEARRNTLGIKLLGLYGEVGTLEVALAQRRANFQLFAYGECALAAYDS